MQSDPKAHSPSSRSRRAAKERGFRGFADASFLRTLGIALLALSVATYLQIIDFREGEELEGQRTQALVRALMAEQKNIKQEGEEPVAPPPQKIVENPEIVTIEGPEGDRGPRGLKGEKGERGKKGEQGDTGDTPTLPPFASLLPPIEELKGDKGDPGEDGTDGTDGADGKNGEPVVSWVFTINGTKYTCVRESPFDSQAPRYKCFAEEEEEPTPEPQPSPTENNDSGILGW